MSYILYTLKSNFLVPLVYHGLPLFYNLSNFFLNVGVCCFPNVQLQRASYTMKAESVTKVSIFYIFVQVYCCCFPTVEF